MRNRSFMMLSMFVLLAVLSISSSGCARSPSNDGVSRIQSPTLSEPVSDTGLQQESKSYQRFDP